MGEAVAGLLCLLCPGLDVPAFFKGLDSSSEVKSGLEPCLADTSLEFGSRLPGMQACFAAGAMEPWDGLRFRCPAACF